MGLSVYMNFEGNAKEVMHYYKEVFGTSEPEIMYFKDMPPSDHMPVTPEMENMVMHGSIKFQDSLIMFSDVPPGSPQAVKFGNNLSMMVNSESFDELKGYFDKLLSEGQVIMPYEKTFWSSGYGMVLDKYGITWQFNCDEEPNA